ncbi:DNA-binding transcriptional repressor ExuR [Oxobacter pfennigii]|uniref:DNA-binding transcriptional repressor ExuR n=1 Tax=Oxobacter pfennigii TaxID=36849 RepID=A0A0P8Z1U7_9CLOT|nr:TrkA C-terminal domain-containing protein [Oxobacter pfennigii]KPU46081.1 DNA-binding transcriptional repressor ExuR [Oxobacter pfennigii]
MGEEITQKPMYQQIALDIARRVVNGDFQAGCKIHGRSTLAGEYNVSPETVRRAVILLQDMDVVSVSHGSGITINSQEEACKFIDKFKDMESIASLKMNLDKLFEDKKEIDSNLANTIEKIIDYSDRLRNISPYNPLEIEIKEDSMVVGETVSSVKFWQNTGATIIAIRRDKDIILSPGPYAEFRAGDVIVVVGDEGVLKRVKVFLNV